VLRRVHDHGVNVIKVTLACRVTAMPIDVFADVPQLELRSSGRRRKFSRGEVVFHEGDPGDSLHRVTTGRFAARVTTPLGDVATFAVHGPGDVFGLLAVVHPEARRTATVVALQASETFAMPRSAFLRLRGSYPSMASAVELLLVDMLTASSSRLVEALYTPVHLRVRARLRDLARIYGGEGSDTVTIPLSQEDLAGLAGTTRETVNRVLQDEQQRGAVTLARRRITVTPGAL
jgi:CRP/FNR family transcriptional regulator, cyclic AMP receptor protein